MRTITSKSMKKRVNPSILFISFIREASTRLILFCYHEDLHGLNSPPVLCETKKQSLSMYDEISTSDGYIHILV